MHPPRPHSAACRSMVCAVTPASNVKLPWYVLSYSWMIYAAGLSLGEYSALNAAGVVDLRRLITDRFDIDDFGEALAALRANADTFSQLCSIARRVWSGRESLVAFAPDHGCHAVEGSLGTHGLDAPEDMLIPHFYGVW